MSTSQVIKRDGAVMPFREDRIYNAIHKAFLAIHGKPCGGTVQRLTDQVVVRLNACYGDRTIPTIEEIQDLVEKTLIGENYGDVAKAYILYRNQRYRLREGKALVLDIEKTMQGYLDQTDWRVNENSSSNYSLGGLILHNAGAVTANYWLHHIYDERIANAHKDGDLHLHDLSMFSGYCAGWSLRQLLELGFGGVCGKINSKPAKHFSTAIWHIINFLGTMQNEWAGAQALASFDTYLAPFIKSENLSYKEVKQHIQSFIYSVNTPSRWGTQPPFTNVTLDWVCPADLANKPVMIDGKEGDFVYGDCAKEMNMFNKAFLDVMIAGDANGRGFSYPIPTYNLTKDFDWDSENADLLFQMTAKYGTPYFQNFINSDLNPSDVRSMCCRLQLDKRELRRRGGGLFGADEFTGSIGVVTLNMPRIGYLAKDETEFFKRLDVLMHLAKDSLECKRKTIQQLMQQGLFPYTRRYLHSFNNHFATIGLVGMHECCLNFLKQSIASEAGYRFTEKVLLHMRDCLSLFQEETGNLYNLEATPAEGTSYRLAKIDKKMYPDIIQSGGEDPYYTNSSNLPVDYTEDVFEALKMQEGLQTKYTGGTVFHVFLGESLPDAASCKQLVRQIVCNFRIPYISIAPTFSVCEDHGRFVGQKEFCPQCGKEMEIYSRITGYYRAVSFWNKGKKEEFKARKTYVIGDLNECSSSHKCCSHASDNGFCLSSVLDGAVDRLFFYSDTCVKCKPLKQFLKEQDFGGQWINVSEEVGLEVAKQYQIRNLPALVIQKSDGPTVINDTEAIKACVGMGF
ncbi:MAG: ribonucleoside triphosphate reductase [Puniceicoccales bacterium]|jgi:ribonucleoside-triphosphate reductase|nr:ribonucleoside triphosphate reductase [Puniceicoccales bacterium]